MFTTTELGNSRGNENPFLLTFGVLWFRFHNFLAEKLKREHPTWGDERLFNEARKWLIAVHQVKKNISFKLFLTMRFETIENCRV